MAGTSLDMSDTDCMFFLSFFFFFVSFFFTYSMLINQWAGPVTKKGPSGIACYPECSTPRPTIRSSPNGTTR